MAELNQLEINVKRLMGTYKNLSPIDSDDDNFILRDFVFNLPKTYRKRFVHTKMEKDEYGHTLTDVERYKYDDLVKMAKEGLKENNIVAEETQEKWDPYMRSTLELNHYDVTWLGNKERGIGIAREKFDENEHITIFIRYKEYKCKGLMYLRYVEGLINFMKEYMAMDLSQLEEEFNIAKKLVSAEEMRKKIQQKVTTSVLTDDIKKKYDIDAYTLNKTNVTLTSYLKEGITVNYRFSGKAKANFDKELSKMAPQIEKIHKDAARFTETLYKLGDTLKEADKLILELGQIQGLMMAEDQSDNTSLKFSIPDEYLLTPFFEKRAMRKGCPLYTDLVQYWRDKRSRELKEEAEKNVPKEPIKKPSSDEIKIDILDDAKLTKILTEYKRKAYTLEHTKHLIIGQWNGKIRKFYNEHFDWDKSQGKLPTDEEGLKKYADNYAVLLRKEVEGKIPCAYQDFGYSWNFLIDKDVYVFLQPVKSGFCLYTFSEIGEDYLKQRDEDPSSFRNEYWYKVHWHSDFQIKRDNLDVHALALVISQLPDIQREWKKYSDRIDKIWNEIK